VPGFRELVDRFEEEVELLVSAPRTVVHGEFTPKNVVWADDRPHPVDWEEAAVGAGEIDIACLTDEWEEDLVEPAIAAYLESRWPDGPPHDFSLTLRAARVYWLMRWLGESEDADEEEDIDWVVGRLNELA
jgi:thiamine kinase-like enzyme